MTQTPYQCRLRGATEAAGGRELRRLTVTRAGGPRGAAAAALSMVRLYRIFPSSLPDFFLEKNPVY